MQALQMVSSLYNGSESFDNASSVTRIHDVTTGGYGSGSGRPGGRPGSGGNGSSGYGRNKPCGYCNTDCIYNAIQMGFVVGVIANLIVLCRVYKDKKLRDTTFIAIACLALADAMFLTVNLVRSFDEVILTVNCGFPSKIVTKPFYVVLSITWFAANSHVALMAILRYITIAYPLRSCVLLSVKRVLMMSGLIWLLGLIFMGTLSLLISYGYILAARSQEFIIYLWTFVYLMPLCITVLLHLLKMCKVKSSTRLSATESTKKAIKRMTKIVFMVILFATILPLPRLIHKIMRVVGFRNAYPSPEFATHYAGIADLLFLINHFINPFMYGFLSKKFRNSMKEIFWFLHLKSSDDSSKDTTDTPLSSRRRNISLDPISPINNSTNSIDTIDAKV